MNKLDKILKARRPSPRFKIIEEINKRWSPRFFSDNRIPEKDLKTIFEAARFAPSGHHNQPWYFYYFLKGTPSYQRLFSALNEYNQSWSKTAPVLILACAIAKNKHGENPFAFYDLGACVLSLILQAQSMGYYSRQMGLFDKTVVKRTFNLNKTLEPYIVIAMGKLGNYENAPKEIIELDNDPRPRKKDFFKKL